MNFHKEPAVFVDTIKLNVTDMEKAVDYYTSVIGLKVLNTSSTEVQLSADGKTPLVFLHTPENAVKKQPGTTGLYHFALLLPSRAHLGRFLKHLGDHRTPVQGASDHLVSEAVYLADPDGNGIEVYADRPADKWEWRGRQVKMATEPLDIESVVNEGSALKWEGMPSDTLMGHIHMHVSDLTAAEQFYCEGLGFNVVTKYGSQALFVSSANYHHHIGLNTWAGSGAPPPPDNSAGIDWFEVVYPSHETRQEALQRLKKLGYEAEESRYDHLFVKDPSNNKLKLTTI